MTREIVKIVAWILGYFVAIWLLGYSLAVVVMTFLYLKLTKERWFVAIVLAALSWVSFYEIINFINVSKRNK